MKYAKWLSFILLYVFIGLPIQAQETGWDGAIYGETDFGNGTPSAELQIITEQGVMMSIPVPITALRPTSYRTQEVIVSPDRRYIALYARSDEFTQLPTLRIADLNAGTCCVDVQLGASDYIMGEFDPTGTRLVFSYVGADPNGGNNFVGGLGTVDAATGQITTVTMSQVNAAINAPDFAAWAIIGKWVAQGVEFVPTCYACDGIIQDKYAIWNPANGQFIPESARHFSIFGQHLGTSAEFLFIEQDESFPASFEVGMFLPENVVKYAMTGGPDNPDAASVYFTGDSLDIGGAYWVDDGSAFVVTHSERDFWDVVRRDGSQFRITGVTDFRIIDGTPTGWLAQAALAGGPTQIYHYNGDTLQGQVIASVPEGSMVEVVQLPQLSAEPSPTPFVPVSPPTPDLAATIQANNAILCLGLRSRIYPNTRGRVTPGTPNRFRDAPSADAEVIGEIPGEAAFTAAGSPICDEVTGILWLPVEYQGQFGWTAEGQNGEYYTEPLP